MLGREFEMVLRERGLQFDGAIYESVMETAITVLTAADFEPQDADVMGEEVSDTVQSHLMLAMLRAPELEPVLFSAIHEYIKTQADAEVARHRDETLVELATLLPYSPRHRGNYQVEA